MAQVEPFLNAQDHLNAELAWVDAGLLTLLELGGGNPFAQPSIGPRGLVVTAEELMEPEADAEEAPPEAWLQYVRDRRSHEREIALAAEASRRAGVELPLQRLCARLRLTVWERRLVVLCLAAETSRKYEKWYAYFNDDITCKAPTPDLAYRLLCDSAEEAAEARKLLSGGAAIRALLLEPEEPYGGGGGQNRPKLKTALRLDERTISYLLRTETLDARLDGIVEAHEPSPPEELPALVPDDPVMRSLQGLADGGAAGRGHVPFVHLSGPSGGGKRLRLAHLAGERRQRLLVVRLRGLPEERDGAATALARIVREAALTGAAIVFREEHAVSGSEVAHRDAIETALNRYVRYAARPLIGWTSQVRRQPSELPVPEAAGWIYGEAGIPPASVREAFWQAEALDGAGEYESGMWRELADKYRFTPGQIGSAWRQATLLAASRGTALPERSEIEAASRGQFRHRLAQLADRIAPARTWDDLVLADEPYSLIREACDRFLNRETVYERWGFGRKLPYGKGLSLLFAGPPGTGKTMAAEIIAGELGLELYRIDLSRIVSKYIGETEQRLSELFAEAENSGAILFFDEGDALFGKRTEVKDAHDKYANLEAAYLLQRIEAYDGVSILATNLLQNMDEALIRRMSFVVKFPFPDAAERERIFRVHLPPEAPVSAEVDLAFLAARLEVSGGYIKNIALAAAFLAAGSGKPIGMEHFIRAARQELRKMGKILVKESFSPYLDEENVTFG
ncbi:ATP-binding protein [Cohnella cellulosilytica]|uniref:ATP-binding protein n=1 Tax=Cohnella cellulosilytica TaxID=986710 RepID=A0ABW2F6Z7_9BACL